MRPRTGSRVTRRSVVSARALLRRMEVASTYFPSSLLVIHLQPKNNSDHKSLLSCSHMTCKKCKYEFCWVCMGELRILSFFGNLAEWCEGPWTEHGTAWYSCNRYDEKESVNARDAQSKSRASLERYLHVRPFLCIADISIADSGMTVLQPMGQPRTIREVVRRALHQDREEDGRDADYI